MRLLLAEEFADAAQDITDLLQLDFGLDRLNGLIDLLVGQIDADVLLDDGGGVLFELLHQLLVGHQFLDDLFDLFLQLVYG